MSFFERIGNWFKTFFTKTVPWTTIALGALNVVAPVLESVIAVVDPAIEPAVAAILTRIQASVGGLAVVLQGGESGGALGLVTALQSELKQLEEASGVKDEATKEKIAALINILKAELVQIEGAAKSA